MEMVSTQMQERSISNMLYKNEMHYKDNTTACLLGKEKFYDISVLSTPLFQVLCVRLISNDRTNLIKNSVLPIYGRIWVTNNHGDVTNVYKRSSECPEIVKPWDSLELRRLEDHVIVPSAFVIVHLELFIQYCAEDVIAVIDQFTFDYTSSNCNYFQNNKLIMGVNSKYSFEVMCATFPFAVAANVESIYFNNFIDENVECFGSYFDDYKCWFGESDDSNEYEDVEVEDDFDAKVFFEITASIYDHFGNYDSNLSRFIPITLLKCREKPIKVKSRNSIKMSKSVLVVPSYSMFKVHVNIWDENHNSIISEGIANFLPCDNGIFTRDIVGEYGCIRIRVKWQNFVLELKERSDRLSIALALNVPSPYTYKQDLLEVFSVVMFSYYDDDEDGKLSVHGKIEVDDYTRGINGLIIFKREEHNLLTCNSAGTILPIISPTRAVSSLDYMSIIISLKDKEGDTFIDGEAQWPRFCSHTRYDKHLCSIIRGDRGFVAVNYTAISDSLRARVDVKLYANQNKENYATKISGNIFARYGNYMYPTQYEKILYQCVVFNSTEELVSPSPNGVALPLLKPMIVFPRTSSLIFEVFLKVVRVENDFSFHIFNDEVEFTVYDGKISQRIIRGEGDYWMQINVEFSEYDVKEY